MIRDAVPDDIPALVAMGAKFAAKAGFADHIGYDPDTVAETLAALIEQGICLIGDDCMAGAAFYRHPFNAGHLACAELFWWSEGREGGALLAEMELQARQAGANSLTMATMDVLNADRMAKVYARKGYRPLDRNFVKVF